MFQGYSFSLQLPGGGPLATSAIEAIEQHGGRVIAPALPLSSATHVVVQHQQQDVYAEAGQHQKAVVTCYWILACAAAKQLLPRTHPTHKPLPSSAIHGAKAYGVSVTAFQGMRRQILLDLLRCMGVGVQKQMHMGTATHVVAQDVDDEKSEKLAYARKPEWADKVSIVNCKWVYDCVEQWQILPADGYKQNCSSTDVIAWQGGTGEPSRAQPAVPSVPSGSAVAIVAPPSNVKGSHLSTAAAPFQHLIASCLQPFKSPIVSSSGQPKQQLNSGRRSSNTVRTVATPAGLGAGLGTSKQRPSRGQTLQASLPRASAAADLDAASAMEDEQHGRESLGGTQGAVTGLTHMALQKHNNAMPAACADASVESQGLGMQVADAEAATARLVAHMTESSPNQDHEPLQLLTAYKAGDVLSAHDTNGGHRQQQLQPQQKHSWDLENIPQVQQHAGKRGSRAQAGHAVPAAGVVAGGQKQPAKRRKVSKDTPAVHPTAAEGGGSAKADGLAPDAKEVVGRVVQQQFEAGIFKGVVKSYMKKHKWFRIEYEDGDRQDLTWEELQPILLPAASEAEPASKPKRKLQPAETHMRRLQPKTAAQQAVGTHAVPSDVPVPAEDASRKPAKPTQAGRRPTKAGTREQPLPSEEEEQAVLAEAPTRADTPAGPRANMGNCPKAAAGCTPCSAGKKHRVMVALGSMHTQEQQAYSSKLARIGVACVSHTQCPRWKPEITHVVLPSLVRSVKSLAGMAAGRWILHADFVEASASAEALVDPEEYELDSGTSLVSPNAPRQWRHRHEVHGTGAFHQLHVLLYGACDRPGPSKDDIALIVQAGEGTVAKCEKPSGMLSRAISGGVQLAVMSSDKQASDPGVKQLLTAKVPCATAQFLIDWLAHPQDDLAGHMLFGSKVAWNEDLTAAAESRTIAAKPQPMSPQI